MKKDSTKQNRGQNTKQGVKQNTGQKVNQGFKPSNHVVGMDIGDEYSRYCLIDGNGEEIEKGRVRTSLAGMEKRFKGMEKVKVVMEAGTHSGWISRKLKEMGHEVIVGNPRKVELISANSNKNDGVDGELLARLGRADEKLLYPIEHRREESQADLELLKARDQLVAVRRKLINHIRGAVKSVGGRLKKCGTESFHKQVKGEIPELLALSVEPLLETVEHLTKQIREYDRQIEKLCREKYQETELLQQVNGVGEITSLGFVLIVDDPGRFSSSRSVGCYAGLRPGRSQSGTQDPELGITKEGNSFLRRLLVQSAHYILGPFGQDCELRSWGLKLAGRGRKNAKKRAVVAVARKLAVLLHRLWVNGEEYDPFYYGHQHPQRVVAS